MQKYRCDSVIVENAASLKALASVWPEIKALRCAALWVGEGDRETPGIRNDPRRYHARVLRLLDTMVRGNITGSQISDLRETVRFDWQEGEEKLEGG